jgi:uncharacterized protein YhaN
VRIERIDIDGFGIFANRSWELPAGLTVFRGDNEEGKSTLLNAIRALLFGFESTRNGRVWYPALAGGKRGGSLAMVDRAGGRWVVTRHGEGGGTGSLKVQAPSGNQGGIETLDRLLHGADKDLFRSIFAFGLSELSDASSMSGDGVHGRIYGAAAGLGGTSALDLELDLRERLEDLFKPSGQKPKLNALFGRMDTLRERIAALAQAPEEHAAAHRALVDAAAEAEGQHVAADSLRARIIRLERSRASAPLITELATAENRLAMTDPALDALEPDAAAAADALAAARDAARTRLDDLDGTIAGVDADLAQLSLEPPLLEAAADLRALESDRAALAGDDQRRADAVAAADRHAATIDEQVSRTRIGSEEALLALDDSIPAVESLRVRERDMTAARQTLADAEHAVSRSQAELDARNAIAFVPDAVAADPAEAAAAIRILVAERRRRPANGVQLAAVVAIALIVGLLVGLVSAAFVIGAAAGLVLLVAGAAWTVWRPSAGMDDPELLARAGLGESPTDEEIERRRDEISVEIARRARAADDDRSLVSLRERLVKGEADRQAAAERLDEATAAWRSWLEQSGIPLDATPEGARQILAAAGVGRRAADDRRAQLEVMRRIDERLGSFEERVHALLDRLAVARGVSAGARLAVAIERLDVTTRAEERRRGLVAQRTKLTAQRQDLVDATEAAQRAVDEHLAACGVADLADLHARSSDAAERRAASRRVDGLREQLVALAGSPKVANELRAEGRALDLAAVEAELAQATRELATAEEAERAALARIGEMNATIRRLEASEELGAARQELAALEGQAQSMARSWAATALAARLMAETRRRYERERQPDVVKAAQAYFRQITDDRYERVAAPPGDGTIRVETASGQQLLPGELSRGTQEQLYLSLRFGLIEEFARRAEPLPVVMDDILVNFDARRAERAAAAIAQLAAGHQVIFFTCRDETAELLDPLDQRTRTLSIREPLVASAGADV